MSTHQHEPVDYSGFRITSLWAYTQIGPDDQEGVIGTYDPETAMLMPLIASDRIRVEDWREVAQACVNDTGHPVTLSRFDVRVDLETLTPPGPVTA